MPEVEIDIDDLLDADSEEERASKLQEALVDCYKPTEQSSLEGLHLIKVTLYKILSFEILKCKQGVFADGDGFVYSFFLLQKEHGWWKEEWVSG
ncbi:protein phosphatase 1 regulatory subunit 14B-like protein [Cricetulus griseus]|nr:protein phosphatase 1 regulatory subunit 14B-like protein [Cricetulus griseus]